MPLIIPIAYFVINGLLICTTMVTKPRQSVYGVALMLGTGLPYYFIAASWNYLPPGLRAKTSKSSRKQNLRPK